MGQFLESSFTLSTNLLLTKFDFTPGHHCHLFCCWVLVFTSCLPKIIVGHFLGEIVIGYSCMFLAWFVEICFFGYPDLISFAKIFEDFEQ